LHGRVGGGLPRGVPVEVFHPERYRCREVQTVKKPLILATFYSCSGNNLDLSVRLESRYLVRGWVKVLLAIKRFNRFENVLALFKQSLGKLLSSKAALRQSFSACVYCMQLRFQSNYLVRFQSNYLDWLKPR